MLFNEIRMFLVCFLDENCDRVLSSESWLVAR